MCNITLMLIQLLFDYQKYALFNKQVVHIVIYSLFLGFFFGVDKIPWYDHFNLLSSPFMLNYFSPMFIKSNLL